MFQHQSAKYSYLEKNKSDIYGTVAHATRSSTTSKRLKIDSAKTSEYAMLSLMWVILERSAMIKTLVLYDDCAEPYAPSQILQYITQASDP